jgi:NAD(P)-dependent dehydrogenase (short-subunit alcohol dehydrogenase family)
MARASVRLHDSLDGQTALVTGANRGIGAAVAAALAESGATVYAGARDPATVTAPGQRPVALDVTDDASVAAAVERAVAGTGRLDALVNNAGVYGPAGPLHRAPADQVARTLDVNLHGPIRCCRHALPHLLATDGGRVVNVSSGSGQFSGGLSPGRSPYAVSKAGLNALTLSLHREYADRGLLANAVCPGWVRTDMGGASAPRSVEEGADTPVWLARFAPGSPGGRLWRDRRVVEW